MRAIEWVAAWRAVRGRGWSAVFIVLLLGVALAANTVMFAFADSLVFRRDPFPDTDRVFQLRSEVKPPEAYRATDSHRLLKAWAAQTDLIAAAGWSWRKTVFLTGDQPIERVQTLDVTTGFLGLLGAAPRWGRGFRDGDELYTTAFAVIISERLAKRRFGSPLGALGKVMDSTAGPHVVIGVMDPSFAYPNASFEMWRVLDPGGPLNSTVGFVGTIVKVHSRVPAEQMQARLVERAPLVGLSIGFTSLTTTPSASFGAPPANQWTLVLMLMGAAICLLLAASANIASLELAAAARRRRLAAVQLALGASKWRLARVAGLEGLLLVSAAAALGYGLSFAASSLLQPNLPDSLRLASNNPVDVDLRSAGMMLLLAALAWCAAVLPSAVATSRASLSTLTRAQDHLATGSRHVARGRRMLTVAQVSAAIVLVVGGTLFGRSYVNLLAVEKGFDSANLYSISWTLPRSASTVPLLNKALTELANSPGIEALTTASPPPNPGDSASMLGFEIAGQSLPGSVAMARKWVDASYFDVVRMPLQAGRTFGSDSLETDVVVPESFARRFFPDGNAVGQRIRRTRAEPWLTIIGVVGDFRVARTTLPAPNSRPFYYALSRTAERQSVVIGSSEMTIPAAAPISSEAFDSGTITKFLTLTVRTDGRVSPDELSARVRAMAPSVPATVSSVDERYAAMSADTRLASQIVAAFGALAFAVAIAGVFGLMVFLVTARTREIGIRMAIGADAGGIQRMVMVSSLRLVGFGLGIGLLGAYFATRAVESQLFGISPTNPWVFSASAAAVLAAGMLAAWYPARLASRVDPAIALRHE